MPLRGPRPDFSLHQEPSFSESCLPKTMAVARRHRRRILRELKLTPPTWPFEDRVLVWLAPHWTDDVAKYHASSGREMAKRFDADQLLHLDEHYCVQLLLRLAGTPG